MTSRHTHRNVAARHRHFFCIPAGSDRDAAAEAALAHVGSGTVVSVELSDDADHVYEVEIDLGNGDDVDVELDGSFTVVKAD